MEQVKDLNTFSSIAFFHLSQPQAPVSSGWHIHCQKLLCKWSSSLHNGRPRWHSCWTLSCSCSGCCVPCCRRPPQCSVEPPQRDPTCWGEHLSCSQLRFEDSWEYRVLETCKKKNPRMKLLRIISFLKTFAFATYERQLKIASWNNIVACNTTDTRHCQQLYKAAVSDFKKFHQRALTWWATVRELCWATQLSNHLCFKLSCSCSNRL